MEALGCVSLKNGEPLEITESFNGTQKPSPAKLSFPPRYNKHTERERSGKKSWLSHNAVAVRQAILHHRGCHYDTTPKLKEAQQSELYASWEDKEQQDITQRDINCTNLFILLSVGSL